MRMLDLFSGIGGFSLAAQWVWGDELEIVSFCEIDKFCQKVLKNHWPDVPICEDIRRLKNELTTDTESHRGRGIQGQGRKKETKRDKSNNRQRIDILTGGFPCQPFSAAGLRKGKDDDRYLWPEMLRIISEFRPTWVVGENVAGIVNMAQYEDDPDVEVEADLFGDETRKETYAGRGILHGIISELEHIGYSIQPFVIPACALNASHRRDRVWIVAHTIDDTGRGRKGQTEKKDGLSGVNRKEVCSRVSCRTGKDASNCDNQGLEGFSETGNIRSQRPECCNKRLGRLNPEWDRNWLEVATELCGVYDELPLWVDGYFSKVIGKDFYGTSNQKNRAKDLSILRKAIQTEEVWEKLGRLFSLDEKEILLKVLCRIEETANSSVNLQCQGKESDKEEWVRDMWKHSDFMRSPRRRQYQEQFTEQLKSIVPELPHETALEIAETWDCLQCCHSSLTSPSVELDGLKLSKSKHRENRLKGLGNAIVPQVAEVIFRAIKEIDVPRNAKKDS